MNKLVTQAVPRQFAITMNATGDVHNGADY